MEYFSTLNINVLAQSQLISLPALCEAKRRRRILTKDIRTGFQDPAFSLLKKHLSKFWRLGVTILNGILAITLEDLKDQSKTQGGNEQVVTYVWHIRYMTWNGNTGRAVYHFFYEHCPCNVDTYWLYGQSYLKILITWYKMRCDIVLRSCKVKWRVSPLSKSITECLLPAVMISLCQDTGHKESPE